jgi:hypothetical protein
LRGFIRRGIGQPFDDVRWAADEGVSETVIAAVLLLHERSTRQKSISCTKRITAAQNG